MLFGNAELHNVEELVPSDHGDGWHLLRLPSQVRATLNESARTVAIYPVGCELRFNLQPGKTATVVLAAEGDDVCPSTVEVYQGCFRVQAPIIRQKPTRLSISHSPNQAFLEQFSAQRKLPFDSRLTRLLLPPTIPVRLIGIEGDITPPLPQQTPARRYLAYGSSITHGANACRPSGTYAMLTARHLGADLINQGYGGGAHLEETMAHYLAGRDDWDFTTLEMGINIGGWKLSRFAQTVEKFVRIITSAHPDKWVFCIDVFTFAPDLGHSMQWCQGYRDAVRQVVADAKLPRVVYVNGLEILPDPAGLSHDLVHPTDDGFAQMAQNLSGLIRQATGST